MGLPKSITVIGRRWFQRTYGNTYHTAQIIVDGVTIHKTPKQYGYDNQYAYTAFQWLKDNKIIPLPEEEHASHWRHIRDDLKIQYEYFAFDVPREKDL
ncbi:MAG: hypothetical protein WC373_13665 [Smithella sp.]|jgi:hypothetical protein